MVFLPSDWLINQQNESKVHELLNELNQDLITDESPTLENVISELEELGEEIIIEKLDNGEIPLGA